MVKNIHGVPTSQWKKWGTFGQEAYNSVRDAGSQVNINPEGHRLPPDEWETVAHNFAFLAACEVRSAITNIQVTS